jgi:hypothetical protein
MEKAASGGGEQLISFKPAASSYLIVDQRRVQSKYGRVRIHYIGALRAPVADRETAGQVRLRGSCVASASPAPSLGSSSSSLGPTVSPAADGRVSRQSFGPVEQLFGLEAEAPRIRITVPTRYIVIFTSPTLQDRALVGPTVGGVAWPADFGQPVVRAQRPPGTRIAVRLFFTRLCPRSAFAVRHVRAPC